MAAGQTIGLPAESPAQVTDSGFPPQWRSFLEQAGASFEGAGGGGFGAGGADPSVALSGDVMSDLSHLALIAVEGPEAARFLASLFTGDVRLVSPTQGQFTSWCDAKGRMLVTFWLFLRDETFYLLVPGELKPLVLTRLRQFLLRTKASIRDASAELVRVGLSGPGMAARMGTAIGTPLPMNRGETLTVGQCTVVGIGTAPQPRWLVIGPVEPLKALWQTLRAETLPVGARVWALLDVLAGIPLLGPETSGEFVPQMVNLEALGGLCFTKGCYPGQEVVARLHYRGQLKRRLYLAYVYSDTPPPAGAKLYGPGTPESVGMVIAAAPAGAGKIALLAVVVTDQKAQGDIHLLDMKGPRLEFEEPEADLALNV